MLFAAAQSSHLARESAELSEQDRLVAVIRMEIEHVLDFHRRSGVGEALIRQALALAQAGSLSLAQWRVASPRHFRAE
jgi:GNAT superfamily N-acetyltransferase